MILELWKSIPGFCLPLPSTFCHGLIARGFLAFFSILGIHIFPFPGYLFFKSLNVFLPWLNVYFFTWSQINFWPHVILWKLTVPNISPALTTKILLLCVFSPLQYFFKMTTWEEKVPNLSILLFYSIHWMLYVGALKILFWRLIIPLFMETWFIYMRNSVFRKDL